MCVNPIKIKNPRLDFDINNDRIFFDVPCGHCVECVQKKIVDWQNRMFFQWLYGERNNGCSYFLTLTYAPKFVPKFYPVRYLPNQSFISKTRYISRNIAYSPVISKDTRNHLSLILYNNQSSFEFRCRKTPINYHLCFSHRDIQLFFKRLRYEFSRDKLDISFKYFVASEYGERYTRRPHYHIILFFNRKIEGVTLRKYLESAWSVGEEQIGWICLGGKEKPNQSIQHRTAINYTAKYIAKDSFSISYLTKLRKAGFQSKDVKEFNPFILASKGLGIGLFNMPDLYNKDFGTMLVPLRDRYNSVPMSLYYIRKLYYNIEYRNDSPCYVINDDGIARNLRLYEIRKNAFINKWLPYFSSDSLLDLFEPFHRLRDLVGTENPSVTLGRVFDYSTVFRGRQCICRNDPLIDEDCFIDSPFEFYKLSFERSFGDQPFIGCYHWAIEFELEEECLKLLTECQSYINYHKYKKKTLEWNRVQSFRTFQSKQYKHCKPRPLLSFEDYQLSYKHLNFIYHESNQSKHYQSQH